MSFQLRFWTCPEPGQLTCAAQVDWATCKRRMRFFSGLPSSFAPLTRSADRYQFSGYPHRIFSIFWVSQAPPRGKLLRWLDRKFYCQFSHRRGAKKKVLELDREFSVGDGSKEIRWGLHGRSSLAGVLDWAHIGPHMMRGGAWVALWVFWVSVTPVVHSVACGV